MDVFKEVFEPCASSEDDSEFEDVPDTNHAKLLESIGVDLTETKNKDESGPRSEPTKDVSVFSLSKIEESGNQKRVYLNQLLKGLKESGTTNSLKKQFNKLQKPSHKLNAPLSKPEADRLQRSVEYKKSATAVGKWDPVVQKNRKAKHMSYPLKQEHLRMKTVDECFSLKKNNLTPLEEQISALLKGNKCAEKPDHELTVMEQETLLAMSLEEAQARIMELRQHRLLLSYQQAKNKRQSKIKSKSYHRMLRKKKMKEEVKREATSGDYNRADRLRAEERASLRHRMGSKWAKSRILMAKHDETTKFELQEQNKKHVELVEKPPDSGSESETPEHDVESAIGAKQSVIDFKGNDQLTLALVKDNPWLSGTRTGSIAEDKKSNVNESEKQISNQEGRNLIVTDGLQNWLNNHSASSQEEETSIVSLKAIKKFKDAASQFKHMKDISKEKKVEENASDTALNFDDQDGLYEENAEKEFNNDNEIYETFSVPSEANTQLHTTLGQVNVKVDSVFLDSSNTLSRNQPKFVEDNEEDDQQRMTIEQAFADDDVLAEFKSEKDDTVEKFNKVEVDLSLPGWGSWGGCGVVAPRKKISRSREPQPSPAPRKDEQLGHVILNEKRDAHIAKHQVNQVPFPFVNKEQFERSVARPIGSTWNTPETVSTLVKPNVSTIMGAIIPPMDVDEMNSVQPVEKKSKKRKLFSQKSKNVKVVASRKKSRLSKLEKLRAL